MGNFKIDLTEEQDFFKASFVFDKQENQKEMPYTLKSHEDNFEIAIDAYGINKEEAIANLIRLFSILHRSFFNQITSLEFEKLKNNVFEAFDEVKKEKTLILGISHYDSKFIEGGIYSQVKGYLPFISDIKFVRKMNPEEIKYKEDNFGTDFF